MMAYTKLNVRKALKQASPLLMAKIRKIARLRHSPVDLVAVELLSLAVSAGKVSI